MHLTARRRPRRRIIGPDFSTVGRCSAHHGVPDGKVRSPTIHSGEACHNGRRRHRVSPSSKRCACCVAVKASLALGQRSWACPCCGAVLDRDGDAAENLRRLGLAAVAEGPVPDDLRARERWIADARSSVAG